MTKKVLNLIAELKYMLYLQAKGGKGSGGWGHDGRLGRHGGSKAGSAGLSKIGARPGGMVSRRRKLAKRVSDDKKPGIHSRKVRERLATVSGKVIARNEKKVNKLKAERDVLEERLSKAFKKQAEVSEKVGQGKLSKAEGEKLYDAISANTEKNFARYAVVEDTISSLTSQSAIRQKQRELIYAKEGPAELTIKYKTRFSKKRKEQTQEGIDEFAKVIGKGTVLDNVTIELKGGGKQRSECNIFMEVSLSTSAGPKTVIHELGHALDFGSSHGPKTEKYSVNAHALAFLEKRTKGETAKKLKDLTGNSNYDNDEIAKPDKFSHPYMGKIYKGVTSEIISMGIEEMWSNPAKFAKEDPEYFDFIYTTLEGARTYGG